MSVAHEITSMNTEKSDTIMVARKIVSSEPAFAEDVESQIKWCKVWGGGLNQKVTNDVCAYIKRCDGDIHRVSATHFEECSKVKINPIQIPSKFVAAPMALRQRLLGGSAGVEPPREDNLFV